jgi:hypothetical protein
LERLREAMQSKPEQPRQPEKPPPLPTDAAVWEDAIADIDRFLESRNPPSGDRDSDT